MFPILFKLHSLARSAFGPNREPKQGYTREPKQGYTRPERTLPRPLQISDCISLPDFPGVTPAPQYSPKLTTQEQKVKPPKPVAGIQSVGAGNKSSGARKSYLTSTVAPASASFCRSEERRVGKECRSRW